MTKLRFTIHEHRAKNIHYDLRLETTPGKILSWALPKPPLRRYLKPRLAIFMGKKPVGVLKLKGIIKEGYGAGRIKLWDTGFCNVFLKGNRYLIIFQGKQMRGAYLLFPKGKDWSLDKGWLLKRLSGKKKRRK
ncbi:hypothetical protein KAT92_05390 [Candidatus Babeliales bacterium]|nr:hypothetical protein [Candidatus Babeliales bacterium]